MKFSRSLPVLRTFVLFLLVGCSLFFTSKTLAAQDVVTFSIDMRAAISQRWFIPSSEILGVRGSIPPLRWDSSLVAIDPEQDSIYTLMVTLAPGSQMTKLFGKRKLAYKFKVENASRLPTGGWETCANSTIVLNGKPQQVKRAFNTLSTAPITSTRSPNVRVHEYFQPKTLVHRSLWVYLPPDYEKSNQRYPVLYMQDGQNLFDDSTAANGEWYADEIATMLIKKKKLPPCIIVGVGVRPEDRLNEYTPVTMGKPDGLGRKEEIGGKGYMHLQMVAEEIKPFIDSTYRTLKDPANTAIGGASLGGLLTGYAALTYPNVFGRFMLMSPSIWWSNGWIVAATRQYLSDTTQQVALKPSNTRFWIDIGTAEGIESMAGTRQLRTALTEKGWKLGTNLAYMEAKDAPHSETAWSERLEAALTFLFGRTGSSKK